MLKRFLQAFLALAVLAGVSGLARADLIYTLDSNNIGQSGTLGTVDLHLIDGTHAMLTFTSNTASNYFFGDSGIVAANVNATSWTLSNLAINSIAGTLSPGAPGNEDGFGSFNQTFDAGSGGPTERASIISFELTNTGGTWADETAVLTNNNKGFQVAAHIFVCPTGIGGDCAVTGFATNGGPPVRQEGPEPGTLSLLGIALLALGTIVARGRKS